MSQQQHYELNLKDEPLVERSLVRIGRYLAQEQHRIMLERNACMNRWLRVYNKQVLPYSNAYSKEICEFDKVDFDEHFYVGLKPYRLKRNLMGWSGMVLLEVLFDKNGKPVRVYFPL